MEVKFKFNTSDGPFGEEVVYKRKHFPQDDLDIVALFEELEEPTVGPWIIDYATVVVDEPKSGDYKHSLHSLDIRIHDRMSGMTGRVIFSDYYISDLRRYMDGTTKTEITKYLCLRLIEIISSVKKVQGTHTVKLLFDGSDVSAVSRCVDNTVADLYHAGLRIVSVVQNNPGEFIYIVESGRFVYGR